MILFIRGGHVIDPKAGIDQVMDLYIEDDIFVKNPSGPADRILDAAGKIVIPGLIDAHCHLREPGYEYREDIESGTKSAVKGGFTTIACMPNTRPVCDHAAIVEYILNRAKEKGCCRVLPIGAVSKGQKGLELAEIGLMAEAGIIAVSDDGRPVDRADLMRKAMQYADDFKLKVISHCEDMSLAEGGHMNEGSVSLELGLRGIPSAAEDCMVARDIILAEYLNLPLHLAHLSTAGSVELVRQAKARGVRITCETCPHYFTLTEQDCLGFNTMAKMNPPLRTQADRLAIIEGLADGTIDIIATDHAPHHLDEKDIEFGLANNGIVGFETAFALGYTYLVKPGHLLLNQLVAKMTLEPARLFELELGSVAEGCCGDLAVIDLEKPFIFDKNKMHSKAANTPFHGYELYGRVLATVASGRVAYEDVI